MVLTLGSGGCKDMELHHRRVDFAESQLINLSRDRERENSLLTEELQRDLPGGPGA